METDLNEKLVMEKKLIHEELSKDIIGAAMEVLNELKPGLDEKLYENALVILINFKYAKLQWKRVVREHE